jgi:hypothetical protein
MIERAKDTLAFQKGYFVGQHIKSRIDLQRISKVIIKRFDFSIHIKSALSFELDPFYRSNNIP